MSKFLKILVIILCMVCSINYGYSAAVTPQKPAVAKTAATDYVMLKTPTVMTANPYAYVNKNVQFQAEFNRFSTLGLDYKPALRETKDYIGILINRDDVQNCTIPLSELKLFLKRSEAEKLIDIESGDKVLIKGKVFSAALGDPWMDVISMKILTQKNKDKTKEENK